ncbi:mmpl domain protein, partial [Nannochloropsis oceanica]
EGGKKKEAVEKDEVDEGYECDESEPLRKGCWLRLARFISHRSYGLSAFVLLLALALPAMVQLKDLETSVEFDLMLPYGSSSYTTLENIAGGFGGPGMVFPFKLLFIDSEKNGIFTETGFERMSAVLSSLIENAPPLQLKDVTGVMALGGEEVSFREMARALNATVPTSKQFTLRVRGRKDPRT